MRHLRQLPERSMLPEQALVLDGNAFTAWADVAGCGSLSSLQRLSLSGNQLADVELPPDSGEVLLRFQQ